MPLPNSITGGDFKGQQIYNPLGLGRMSIGKRNIDKTTVESVELIDKNRFKTKNTVAIYWRDGKKSMAEVDNHTYKQLMRNCF